MGVQLIITRTEFNFMIFQICKDGWTSMKGSIKFWIHFNPSLDQGFVFFYGNKQRCKRIHSKFEDPMLYPEEARKVSQNGGQELNGS